jgi:hypothetical protein
MVNVIYNSGEDYSKDVIGEWSGVQYLKSKQLVAFDEYEYLNLTFDEEYVKSLF